MIAIIGCSSGSNAGNEEESSGTGEETSKEEEQTNNEGGETPTIHFYQNTGIMAVRPEGSTSSELEKIHQYLLEQTGVDVNVIVPPTGAEEERLNLLLGSSDDLDVFGGDWQDYANQG